MDSREAYRRTYPSLYRGIVEDNVDPKNIGRCRVRVPYLHGGLDYPVDLLPWARPLVLSPVKKSRGSVNIPDIGDIVWVIFEGANSDCPVYFGGSYAIGELDIDKDIVDMYVEGVDRISYSRKDRYCVIKVGDNYLKISQDSIDIVGNASISGDLSVSGTLTVGDIFIRGSCNKECDCT